MSGVWWAVIIVVTVAIITGVILYLNKLKNKRKLKGYERALKMVPMLIHLPPRTDDIQGGGRDERDVTLEALSQAQTMYSIIASTITKGRKARVFGQKHISFEIIAKNGSVNYYAIVPAVLTEMVKQAVNAAYPTAMLEEVEAENIFSKEGGARAVVGGEMVLKKEAIYPINTFEETKKDASLAILNAMSTTKEGEGMAISVMVRPAGDEMVAKAKDAAKNIKEGKKVVGGTNFVDRLGWFITDIIPILVRPMQAHETEEGKVVSLTNLQQEEMAAIENKTKYPEFETKIQVIASSTHKERSEALISGVVAAFSQFDSPVYNGFKYNMVTDGRKLATDYIFKFFPLKERTNVLNSIELASIFHLPEQNAIPTSQVERQNMKQVDGPAKLVKEGILLGENEFRGIKKEIRLSRDDRRRHTYVIGSTGMGKSVFMKNIAYQDMVAGRGFAFIDPHGDVVEELLAMVPPERVDDVIYFDPGNLEMPIGMNMFEYQTDDQKDFIVQEGINMLYSLFDPGHTGIFGPRGEHMFRNAALLLMSDPNGATFIDIPKCFIDPEFVKEKLQYVTDRNVFDYWTKEFPASQRSNDAGEVTTWFVSKWGPFISNTMIRNVLGQTKSGFNIRDIMDKRKILLVNLSKGKMGEVNSKLLGMIFVMKFQTAAMSRVDTEEDKREDFCLFVDEFQNFSTESFESILSEARKFRLNLIVANQFMTQLTDKIREGILGNVGTVVAGRLGVTDAELMEKVFAPTFTAEDLHKTPNHYAVATVMMYGVPSTPFTMTWGMLGGKGNTEVAERLKAYVAMKYGRPRAEVETEINERMKVKKKEETAPETTLRRTETNKEAEIPTIEIGEAPKVTESKNMAPEVDPEAEMPVEATERPVEASVQPETSRTADGEENYLKIR